MSDANPPGAAGRRSWPERGRVAAVDYGTVRIGVAISDLERRLASPLENYQRSGAAADARFFRRLVADEQIVGWIVGLPVHTHGGESQKSREAQRFGAWLSDTTGLPVAYYDERFTTAEADEILNRAGLSSRQRRARRDKLAAQILLSAYLESPHRADQPPEPLD